MAQYGFGALPPGLAGWVAADQLAAQQQNQKLGALQTLMQIENQRMQQAEYQRGLQEQEQLRGVLAQSGGNPEIAIKALVASGSPKAIELATKLKSAFAKPEGQAIGAGGLRLPSGEIIPPAARPAVTGTFSNVHNVPGGYIEEYEPGKRRFVRTQREPAEPVSERIVQDPQSPTGWSYEDARTRQRRLGAPPPASVAKKSEKEEALEKGKNQVSDIIGNLNAQYQELSNAGAIADTSKGTAYNIQRAITSSTPGQVAGRVLGTETQGIRNRINMTRPLLMNAIRQATGQSAKSLDSNVELQFYLQAATNTNIDIQSNLAALDHLDKLYGLGIGIKADPNAAAALKKQAPVMRAAPEGVDPKIWAVMTPQERALWQK